MKFITVAALGIFAAAGASHAQDYGLSDRVNLGNALSNAPAPAGERWVLCQVAEVGGFDDRTHVRCANGEGEGTYGKPSVFLAVDNAQRPALAAALAAAGLRARSTGEPMAVLIDQTESANPPGCLPHDCRRLAGFVAE